MDQPFGSGTRKSASELVVMLLLLPIVVVASTKEMASYRRQDSLHTSIGY
jgi:hypothetical protein